MVDFLDDWSKRRTSLLGRILGRTIYVIAGVIQVAFGLVLTLLGFGFAILCWLLVQSLLSSI